MVSFEEFTFYFFYFFYKHPFIFAFLTVSYLSLLIFVIIKTPFRSYRVYTIIPVIFFYMLNFLFLGMFTMGVLLKNFEFRDYKNKMNFVIDTLEKYKSLHSKYPQNISEIKEKIQMETSYANFNYVLMRDGSYHLRIKISEPNKFFAYRSDEKEIYLDIDS